MAIPSRQIGWSTTDNLLWQISKQLEYLTQVVANPPASTSTTTTVAPTTTTTTTTVAPAGDLLTTLNGDNLVTLSGDQIITL